MARTAQKSDWWSSASGWLAIVATIVLAACGWIYSYGQLNEKVENGAKTFTQQITEIKENTEKQNVQTEKKFDALSSSINELSKAQTLTMIGNERMSGDVKGLVQGMNDIKDSLRKK